MRKPTEFRYHENQAAPHVQPRRRLFRWLLGSDDLLLPDDVVGKIAGSYFDADPVAEAFVDDIYIHGPPWYPESLADAVRFGWMIFSKGAGQAGEDEKALSQSFARIFDLRDEDRQKGLLHRARAALARRRLLGYINLFVSAETRQRNDVPAARLWRLYPLLSAPARFLFETLRRLVPGMEQVADRLAQRRTQRWFAFNMPDRKAEYTAVSSFTR